MTTPEATPITIELTAHQRTIYRGLVARAERAREAVQTFESALAAGVLEEADTRRFAIRLAGSALQLIPADPARRADGDVERAAS